jgi:hypothetical protein
VNTQRKPVLFCVLFLLFSVSTLLLFPGPLYFKTLEKKVII